MKGLRLVPYDTNIDFVGIRKYIYAFSIAVMLVSFASLFKRGLNLGIDFKGGFLIEVRTPEKADVAGTRKSLEELNVGSVKLQEFGSDRDVMIRIEQQKGGEEAQTVVLEKSKDLEYRRVETVGPKVSDDLVKNGIWALGFALVGMLIYVSFRFEWYFGVCGILALIHDTIAVMGFYTLSGLEFSETAFVAILTTIGYSINDSVVIYDRIRENLRKFKKMPMAELINKSTNETLSRTVLTAGTTIVSLIALCTFGGPVIRDFSLPILVGITFGVFSSIFVSANLLLLFNVRRGDAAEAKAE